MEKNMEFTATGYIGFGFRVWKERKENANDYNGLYMFSLVCRCNLCITSYKSSLLVSCRVLSINSSIYTYIHI